MAHHLLAFGTANYQDAEIPSLEEVPHELEKIVRLFSRFGYAEALQELRHDPTSVSLIGGVEDWLRGVAHGEDDVAVIYYTGHGFTEGGLHYLAATDTRQRSVATAMR